jgi:hypothetical protein
MKHALRLGIFLAAIGAASAAKAQNYPWCEYLGGEMGGARNCGFISFDQCMLSASGNGGDCRQNTQYTPPPGPHDALGPSTLHRHGTPRRHHHS